jgi:hypothetical protein
MADMTEIINRYAAYIHAHFAGFDWFENCFFSCQGVINLQIAHEIRLVISQTEKGYLFLMAKGWQKDSYFTLTGRQKDSVPHPLLCDFCAPSFPDRFLPHRHSTKN